MVTSIRLFIIMTAIILLQAFYYLVAGSAVIYFSPRILVLVIAFTGLLLGRRYGLLYGAVCGLLEEICFIEPSGILGLHAITYVWIGFFFGSFVHRKAHLEHPITPSVIAIVAFLMELVIFKGLGFIFQSNAIVLHVSLSGFLSVMLNVALVAPIFFRLMVSALEQERYV
ncbi:rod shape-determining protein MreD [Elusimicrobiota bacterium]